VPSSRGPIEVDLSEITEGVVASENASGRNRLCTFGFSPVDRRYLLHLPSGYDEIVARVHNAFGSAVEIQVEDWVCVIDWRDGSVAEGIEALRRILTDRGIDPDAVARDAVRFDSGSSRAGMPNAPHYRCLVRGDILDGNREQPAEPGRAGVANQG
jgi:hypothetical protein